ncbi:PssE/Cps14G family polysaccharide biosynthesis glycosyltransferase [Alteromonadaceae bacterium BrNp21-10]|nr:PssE/Cps14G family polysaccharide biosynthesis glycosyltransferase [Alteromonadaceae bacterium BrNp21-10]
MKVLVTVGTTAFEGLISYIDQLKTSVDEFELQIGPTDYTPSNYPYFQFIDDIEKKYLDADVIISHCGAGSTYRLLELGKPLILVPNLERVDQHQKDLARFMEQGNYAYTAWAVEKIPFYLDKIRNDEFNLEIFTKENFSAKEYLQDVINRSLG